MKTTLQSPNLTGKKWITRLEKGKYQVSSHAKELLETIVPTKNSYDIVILKMDKDYYTTQEVREEAQKRGYTTPPVELAPLLREEISDEEIKELGLWWLIVAHEPITASDGDPRLLGLSRSGDGQSLSACWDSPVDRWFREDGFVFLAPQGTVSSKTQNSSVTLSSDSSAELSSEARLENAIKIVKDAGYKVIKEM